jgi:hypothetical protein
LLLAKIPESVVADDGFRFEVLKFGRIGPSFRDNVNQVLCATEVAIVIGGDIRDEIGRVVTPDLSLLNL